MSVSVKKWRRVTETGTAASGGGTFVVNVTIPDNRGARLEARVSMTHKTAGAIDQHASLYAETEAYTVAGVATQAAAVTGSANPKNSANLVASQVQATTSGFQGGGGTQPTAAWTVVAGDARLTVTNPGAVGADVAVFVEVWESESS